MIEIDIPGGTTLQLAHLVLDFNGTLAVDGELIQGVGSRLEQLAKYMHLHVLTADTHGTVAEKLKDLPCTLHIIESAEQDKQKRDYVFSLGAGKVVAVGNGRNDSLMLKDAALGLAVIHGEGGCSAAVLASDIVFSHICDGLDCLLKTNRIRATLRN